MSILIKEDDIDFFPGILGGATWGGAKHGLCHIKSRLVSWNLVTFNLFEQCSMSQSLDVSIIQDMNYRIDTSNHDISLTFELRHIE